MRFSDRLDAGRVPLAAFELAAAPIAALAGLVTLVFVWGAIATTRLVGDVLSVGESVVGAMIAVVVLVLAALVLTAATWIVSAYRRYFAHPDRGRNTVGAVAAPLVGVAAPLAYALVAYGSAGPPWWLSAFVLASVHVVAFRAIALYSARSGEPRSGVLAALAASLALTVFVVTSVTERILERTAGDGAGAGQLLAEVYAWPGVPPNRLLLVAAPLLVALLYGPVRSGATTQGSAAAGAFAAAAAGPIRRAVGRLRPTGGSGPHVDQSRPQQPPVSARRSSSRSSSRSTDGGSNPSSSSSSGGSGSIGGPGAAGDGGIDRAATDESGPGAGDSSDPTTGSSGPSTGSSGSSGASTDSSSAPSSSSTDSSASSAGSSGASSDSGASGDAGASSASSERSSADGPPTGESPSDDPLVEGAESETQIFTGDFQEYEQESDSVETCPACEEDVPSDGVYNFCPFCAEEL